MASNVSSAQLHVTFDVGDKHGGIFTYVEMPRNLFNIFIICFGICMYVLDVHAKGGLFVLFRRGFFSNLNSQTMLRCATPGDSIVSELQFCTSLQAYLPTHFFNNEAKGNS